ESAEVSERGLAGDRAYAFIDTETGKIVSAKNPRKWPGLLRWSATYTEAPTGGQAPPVRVEFPDGTSAMSNEAGFDERASKALSRAVVLRSVPVEAPVLEEYWPDIDGLAYRETVTDEAMSRGAVGCFFDFSAIHLVTTSTLAALARAYPQGRFDVCRFRPNLVIATEGEGFVENDWVGRQIRVGEELTIEVAIPCPRCVMTTLPQRDLPLDSGILVTAARHNNAMIAPVGQAMPSVGVYGHVVRGGGIRAGDAVRLD
ncbi:MAG TPA: MOSC domain-containing protein, partial [Bryobacteraceae bacterium]